MQSIDGKPISLHQRKQSPGAVIVDHVSVGAARHSMGSRELTSATWQVSDRARSTIVLLTAKKSHNVPFVRQFPQGVEDAWQFVAENRIIFQDECHLDVFCRDAFIDRLVCEDAAEFPVAEISTKEHASLPFRIARMGEKVDLPAIHAGVKLEGNSEFAQTVRNRFAALQGMLQSDHEAVAWWRLVDIHSWIEGSSAGDSRAVVRMP